MKKWCLKKKQRCLAYCFLITYFTLSFIGSIIGSDFLSILSLIVLVNENSFVCVRARPATFCFVSVYLSFSFFV